MRHGLFKHCINGQSRSIKSISLNITQISNHSNASGRKYDFQLDQNFHIPQFNSPSQSYSTIKTASSSVKNNSFRQVGEIKSIKDMIDVLDTIYADTLPLIKLSQEQQSMANMPISRKHTLWFRGQSDVAWDISPWLYRGDFNKIDGNETQVYIDEQNALFNLTAARPELKKHMLFDVLALAQHHTLPTRLLDWSQSAVNALLFAVKDKNKADVDGELFVLNPMRLNFKSIGKYGICRPEHPEVILRAELSVCKSYKDLLEGNELHKRFCSDAVLNHFSAKNYIEKKYEQYKEKMKKEEPLLSLRDFSDRFLENPVAVFPLWKDNRLLMQQGMFTIHGGKFYFDNSNIKKEDRLPPPKHLFDIQTKVVSNDSLLDPDSFLISFKIPAASKYSIERELRRLGINEGALFPELEYQAKYIKSLWNFPKTGIRIPKRNLSSITTAPTNKKDNISNISLENDTESTIRLALDKLLEKARKYKSDNLKSFDRRILIEMYGFAFALSREIEDNTAQKEITDDIISVIKEFIFEDLHQAKNIELDNLATSFEGFKNRLEAMRKTQFKEEKYKEFLKEMHEEFESLLNDIFEYVHGILGKPPKDCKHVVLSIGSLATRLVTPYSDIEYIVLVDELTEENRSYFINFADLFELLIISLGESPIYKAESLLEEFKNCFKYIKKGSRVDEHKRPQDINRKFGLVLTPKELLANLPIKIVHKWDNHLTAALLTISFLDKNSDEDLYKKYLKLYKQCLETNEYVECLRKLLNAGVQACKNQVADLKLKVQNNSDKEEDIKKLLIPFIHIPRELLIFLRSCGEKVELKETSDNVLLELHKGKYISDDLYRKCSSIIDKLMPLRLQKQINNNSAEAKITLTDLGKSVPVQEIIETLKSIADIAEKNLEKKKDIQKRSLKELLPKNDGFNKSSKYVDKLPEVWNVPRINTNFIERFKDDKREITLLDQIKNYLSTGSNNLVSTTVIQGLGGIGKTQLALQYVWQNYKNYKGVCWFNAESKERLMTDYVSLGHELHLFGEAEKNISSEEKAKIVKTCLEHPSRAGWLLVYDNALKQDDINNLLPVKEGKILITSRHTYWPQHQTMAVGVFSLKEAQDYMKKIIGEQKFNEKSANQLIRLLGFLPLAIAQACAYLQRRKINVSNYLDLYQKKHETLLVEQLLPEIEYQKAVAITWNITLDQMLKQAPESVELLYCCGHLHHEQIPENLALYFFNELDNVERKHKAKTAISIAQEYSMINVDEQKQTFSMHNLVQQTIRYQLTKESKDFDYLLKGTKTLTKLYLYGKDQQMVDSSLKRILTPHLEEILKYFNNYLLAEERKKQEISNIERGTLLPVLICLVDAYSDLGDAKRKKEVLKRALPIQEDCYGKEHFIVAMTLNDLGLAYFNLGYPQEAKKHLERARIIKEAHYGKEHVEVAITLHNLANACGALGDLKEKKKLLEERALPIYEKHYGKEHFNVATILNDLGMLYNDLGKPKDAETHLTRALEIHEKHDKEHIEVARVLNNLANARGAVGDLKGKKDLLERSLKIYKKHYGEKHVEVGIVLNNLGNVNRALRNTTEAKNHLTRALEIYEDHYGKEHVEVANVLNNLANVYAVLGNAKETKMHLDNALRIQKAHYGGKEHVVIAITLGNLSLYYLQQDNLIEAKNCAQQAYNIFINPANCGENHPNTQSAKILLDEINQKLSKLKNTEQISGKLFSGIFNKTTANMSNNSSEEITKKCNVSDISNSNLEKNLRTTSNQAGGKKTSIKK